jgi:uncharacterized protein with ACT and thioredoxin-like domain
MKKFFYILVFVLAFVSCKDDDNSIGGGVTPYENIYAQDTVVTGYSYDTTSFVLQLYHYKFNYNKGDDELESRLNFRFFYGDNPLEIVEVKRDYKGGIIMEDQGVNRTYIVKFVLPAKEIEGEKIKILYDDGRSIYGPQIKLHKNVYEAMYVVNDDYIGKLGGNYGICLKNDSLLFGVGEEYTDKYCKFFKFGGFTSLENEVPFEYLLGKFRTYRVKWCKDDVYFIRFNTFIYREGRLYYITKGRMSNSEILYRDENNAEHLYATLETYMPLILLDIEMNSEGTMYMLTNLGYEKNKEKSTIHGYSIIVLEGADEEEYLIGGITKADSVHIDGDKNSARFTYINDMTIDGADNLYLAEKTCIRKMTRSGNVTTIAGTTQSGNVCGAIEEVRFSDIRSIYAMKDGRIYIDDAGELKLLNKEHNNVEKLHVRDKDVVKELDIRTSSYSPIYVTENGIIYRMCLRYHHIILEVLVPEEMVPMEILKKYPQGIYGDKQIWDY